MKNNILELNRQEIAEAVYRQLFAMAEGIVYGSISCNITIHNGLVSKVDYSETRKKTGNLKEVTNEN